MKKLFFAAVAASMMAACGGGQSSECKKWLECQEAITPNSTGVVNSTYGPDGTCWKTSEATTACNANCTAGLTALKAQFPTQAACQ